MLNKSINRTSAENSRLHTTEVKDNSKLLVLLQSKDNIQVYNSFFSLIKSCRRSLCSRKTISSNQLLKRNLHIHRHNIHYFTNKKEFFFKKLDKQQGYTSQDITTNNKTSFYYHHVLCKPSFCLYFSSLLSLILHIGL